MPPEIWKDIENYEGLYQVSDLGRVKSLERIVICSDGRSNPVKERILKFDISHRYYRVRLCDKNTKQRKWFVHVLVAEAFKANPDNLPSVDHIREGNRRDNRAVNLQWITHRDNSKKYSESMDGHSKFIGVSLREGKWSSTISLNKVRRHLGVFDTEEEAAEAYLVGLEYINKNNKLPPRLKKKVEDISPNNVVYWDKSRNKFQARIRIKGKNTFVGRYDTIEEANEACNKKREDCKKLFNIK